MEISEKKKDGYFYFGKGFTLIELLVVIALIGILASIVLVMMSAAKDNARRKAVYSKMRSAQAQASQCLIGEVGWINCFRTYSPSTNISCRGNISGLNSKPGEDRSICTYDAGGISTSIEKWPVISGAEDFKYLHGACSRKDKGVFDFAVSKNESNPDDIFCCTHLGCTEIAVTSTLDAAIEECKTMAGLGGYGGGECANS